MSKKHFIALADELASTKDGYISRHGVEAWNEMLDMVCRFCRSQNWRFNEARFRGYIDGTCGPRGGAVKATCSQEKQELFA